MAGITNKKNRLAPFRGPSEYEFGTDGEIANRVSTGYWQDPQNHAPSFTQIGPGGGGKNANKPDFKTKDGDMKFSNGPNGL